MPDQADNQIFILPSSTAQPIDVGRLLREINLIDEHLKQVNIRSSSQKVVVKTSNRLAELLEANNLDVTNKTHRENIVGWLTYLRERSPRVNISFGTEAGEDFIQKIAEWFRKEIDPYCLLNIGYDPSIGVGSIVRTRNKVFDFSLKHKLKSVGDPIGEIIDRLGVKPAP